MFIFLTIIFLCLLIYYINVPILRAILIGIATLLFGGYVLTNKS